MLYELIAVTVLRGGGVIRGYTNWGVFMLPKPTTKHQTRHTHGHHFIMRFDAPSEIQQQIRNTLSLNPRMIRFGVVKLGDRLDQIKDIGGTVPWIAEENESTLTKYFT
ncbi:37S ribosomal protein Mrp17 [Ascosphaera apis ARSEF 7405]|uniref:37S ribosomal protein Mrp17 n=1 Tax=Ascosphaera apis ARSEF 7405 TaxID=392613 RepID=A0A167XHL7_9EURO|nr:37S ribosomal protein Mrp17 [Ascosphaera apis ARSEF 7405]